MTSNAREIVLKLLDGGMTRQAIADEIDYSRTAVSLYLDGKYGGDTKRIERAIFQRFNRFPCPHLKAEITQLDCAGYALRPCPTSNARDARHWRACQACPHKPNNLNKPEVKS